MSEALALDKEELVGFGGDCAERMGLVAVGLALATPPVSHPGMDTQQVIS